MALGHAVLLDELWPRWILDLRADGTASRLFPLIWVTFPLFWLTCCAVRLVEGKRQAFSPGEAALSLLNQMILGALWSAGPVVDRLVVDPTAALEGETWTGLVAKTAAAAVVVDAAFYWIHRAMHDVPALRWIHARHHLNLARHTVWGALDENPIETLTIFAYITLPFALIPAPPELIVAFIAAGSVQTVLMHGTVVGGFWLPPWPLVGARIHHGHHVTITKSFGGVTVFWDTVMGTARKERDAPTKILDM